ncbi:MAG: hypothetical protein HFJ09_06835, partial [Lachnospiraceae bacterium]|nr:hypothetical protein [Lachnospiraceae bacterium]
HIGASHEQPPEGAETSGMAPLPEVEFIENVGKAVSGVMDMAVSAVESAEKFLNDCACEVSSWNWGFFNSLLDGARGYSGEGGEFSRNKFWGAVTKGTHNFVFGTAKGLLNIVGHPVETAKGIGHAVTHPKELLNGLKEQYWGSRKNWVQKVSGVTEAACDIAFLLYGAKKGFNKLSKGSKAGKAAKMAESGETAGEAAKVGEEAVKAGEKAGGKGKVKIESAGKSGGLSNNPQSFLQRALKNQGLNTTPNRLKETWIDGDYKYTVRIHEGNTKYTNSSSIYRVSRQSTILDANGQGTGLEYLGTDGNWYHQSVLVEFFKGGTPNPDFNQKAARITHIAINGGN